jgi:predicted  nucleic acid-binding Zn-ribbon protein
MKLYEIDNIIQQKIDEAELMYNETGKYPDQFTENINALEMIKTDKITNIAKYIVSIQAEIVALQEEIDRMKDKISSRQNKIEFLRSYIQSNMTNDEKIKDPFISISFRKSESVEISDMSLIPDMYKKTKTEISPDKIAIKDAIKNGQEISGAQIMTNYYLQIKP